jgi:hypothetical protein
MWPILSTISTWLQTHEFVAIWLEGIALVAIFIWDRVDSRGQHRQTVAQMKIMQSQANALINSERAWVAVEVKWDGRFQRIVSNILGETAEDGHHHSDLHLPQ